MTKEQLRALENAFRKGGAVYEKGGSRMGGAKRRMYERLADAGYLKNRPPFPIDRRGLEALRDHYTARYNANPCEAFRLDLEAVAERMKEL